MRRGGVFGALQVAAHPIEAVGDSGKHGVFRFPLTSAVRTQVSLLPPPWDEFTTSEPLRRATRVRPPGTMVTLSPIQNVRAQIDVTGLQAIVDQTGGAREVQSRLSDVVAGIGFNAFRETLPAARRCCAGRSAFRIRPDSPTAFTTSLSRFGEHMLALIRIVKQDRFRRYSESDLHPGST